jgi:O-antigen ligase
MMRATSIRLPAFSWRALALRMAQGGVLVSLVVMPVWLRLGQRPDLFAPLYVSRFVLLLPLLWTIGWWAASGFVGFSDLVRMRSAAIWAACLGFWALWASLSQNWAFVRVSHPATGANASLQIGLVVAFALAVASLRLNPVAVAATLAIGLTGHAVLAIAQADANGAVGLRTLGEFPYHAWTNGVSIVRSGTQTIVRPFGLMPHPNILAGFLTVGVLASAGLWAAPGRIARVIGLVCAPLLLYALLLTFSRAAWLGLAVGGLILFALGWRRLRVRSARATALAGTLACVIAGAVFVAGYADFIGARTATTQESVELRSISDRIVFTDFALRAIGEKPLTGVGAGSFPWRSSAYLQETFFDLQGDNVHNIYLLVWAELGTPGLVLFLVAIAAGLRSAWVAVRRDRSSAGIALLASFVALAVVGLFDHYPYSLLHPSALWWTCLAAALSETRSLGTATGFRNTEA